METLVSWAQFRSAEEECRWRDAYLLSTTEATLDDCQTIAQNLFFSDGCCEAGDLEEMITTMADLSGNLVALMKGEKPYRFSAERYKQRTGLSVPRLYL